MKNNKIHFVYSVLFFYASTIVGMEIEFSSEETLLPHIPLIVKSLDLATASSFLRSCKCWHNSLGRLPVSLYYNVSIPLDRIARLQFGVSRLLLNDPELCNKLQPYEYTNALVYYAQQGDRFMFKHMMNCESPANAASRLGVLEHSGHWDNPTLENCMLAYLVKQENTVRMIENEQLARVFVLNGIQHCCKWNKLARNYCMTLEFLIQNQFTSLIPLIAKHSKECLNIQSAYGFTPLIFAIRK